MWIMNEPPLLHIGYFKTATKWLQHGLIADHKRRCTCPEIAGTFNGALIDLILIHLIAIIQKSS